MKIEPVLGDITTETTDAIVNAANRQLMGGGGVDGAIWAAAGYDDMLAACSLFQGCAVGECKVTPGFALAAKWVIHTVGPVWYGGAFPRQVVNDQGWGDERRVLLAQLADCYLNSMGQAAALGCRSVAFPAIGTGAFRWPPELAARVAVTTLRSSVTTLRSSVADLVRLVAYDERTLELYERELGYADPHAIRRAYDFHPVLPLPERVVDTDVAELVREGIEKYGHR